MRPSGDLGVSALLAALTGSLVVRRELPVAE